MMNKKILLILSLLLSPAVHAEPQNMPVLQDEAEMQGADASGIMIDAEDLDFDHTVDAFGNAVNLDSQTNVPLMQEPKSQNADTEQRVHVNTRQTLTENIKENAAADVQETEGAPANTTWINQLITSAKENIQSPSETSSPLANMLEQSQGQNRRSNAAVFDISGVMLRMSFKQAEDALKKRGYKMTMQKMDVPNFIRWRNEDQCRGQGVVGYERLENCVIKLAKKGNYQFISQAQFNKYDSQETVQIFLTSTFTGNKIYKITYRSEAANVTGNSQKAMYLRNIKVYDFWKKINQKYGVPDNKNDVIWGLGSNKPYLKAATGFLLLEDNMLRELDYTRMSREDQRFMNTDVYTF